MSEPKRGRPAVVPGEQSVEIRGSIELSLYRRIRQLAQDRREEIPDVLRAALREFVRGKIDGPSAHP